MATGHIRSEEVHSGSGIRAGKCVVAFEIDGSGAVEPHEIMVLGAQWQGGDAFKDAGDGEVVVGMEAAD